MRDRKRPASTGSAASAPKAQAGARRATAPRGARLEPGPKFRSSLQRRVLAWGRANYAHYPWRARHVGPWLGLVAEVLLQRTRAEQVVGVYEEFAQRYPTPEFLVRESAGKLRKVVGPLGLHWRAPLLIRMAREVVAHDGPPNNAEKLTELPGVGPYAAAAYLSFHRGKRAVIIDSNVVRWLGRVFGFPTDPETRRKRWLLELADKLTPQRAHRAYNFAILDLSMKLCAPRPKCERCPLPRSICTYRRTTTSDERGRPRRADT